MRKLASIQCIKAIEPIPNADAIVKATVLGWQVVVKKDEFAVGDFCVYAEIDSVFPEQPEFEFLRNKNFRIRTVKMRGQISQGICFPLSILPQDIPIVEGYEVTEALGIVKYEPPIPSGLAGLIKGGFPSFIPKTDETRVQVLQDLLDEHKGKLCSVTEKVDGTSATFFVRDGVFGVCSRNLELAENAGNTYWKLARQLDIEAKLTALNCNIAIQGEIVGEGIQGNKLCIKGQRLFVFNMFFIDEYRYAQYAEMVSLLNKLNLDAVPLITDTYRLGTDIQQILKMANIPSTINSTVMAEGLVIRVMDEKEIISFKAISNEFLLKYGE